MENNANSYSSKLACLIPSYQAIGNLASLEILSGIILTSIQDGMITINNLHVSCDYTAWKMLDSHYPAFKVDLLLSVIMTSMPDEHVNVYVCLLNYIVHSDEKACNKMYVVHSDEKDV